MAKLNTNGNAYTIIYASVMVIIVAFLLAFVASALKPKQDANVALDTKKQILSSLNIRDLADAEAEAKYSEVITSGELDSPTLTANVDGEEKLIVAVKGDGFPSTKTVRPYMAHSSTTTLKQPAWVPASRSSGSRMSSKARRFIRTARLFLVSISRARLQPRCQQTIT